MLHLASLLAQFDLEKGDFDEGAFIVDSVAWQLTGLTEENCLKAQQMAAEQFKEVAESITALDFS